MTDTSDPIVAAITAAELPPLLDALRVLTPAQRHERRAMLLQWAKRLDEARWGAAGLQATNEQIQALHAALVVCGTAADLTRAWISDELLVALCREFRPRALDGLADVLLAHSPAHIRVVQALIAAGLVPRPVSADYVLGLIALPQVLRDADRLRALLAADPGLPSALLRVFELEGTADTSLASSDKYNHVAGLAWGTILLGLVERGVATRADLLDRTLAVLANDWPQYRSGWFARFHAELAPDAEAMQPHRQRYLALCDSRIAPTVGLALDALVRLDAALPLDEAALFDALRPVFAGEVKAQIEAALKLVDRAVQRAPQQCPAAARLITTALLLDSAPLQKVILRRLEAWGLDESARSALRSLGAGIAAVNRPVWQRLAGEVDAPVVAPEPAAPVRRADPLDAARRIAPIDRIEDLAECIAHVFENDTDVDAFERALAGVVVLAPFADAQRRALAPVLKRAAKVRKPIALMLARLLAAVVEGREIAVAPGVDGGGHPSPVQAMLLRRIDELASLADHRAQVLPLSTPTHRRGFIDPAAMVERVAAHQARGVRSSSAEQVLGLLRLAPNAGEAVRAQARGLADDAFTRALRYALGDAVDPGPEPELFAAAARIRHPGADDAPLLRQQGDLGPDAARTAQHRWRVHRWENRHPDKTYVFHDLVVETAALPPDVPAARLAVLRHPPAFDTREVHTRWWSFGGIDEGAVAWSATLLPSCLETFCAEGARAIGNNLDWWEAQWHNAAYLRLLLDPSCALGPMATLLLALGLLGKEPGQTAIAVDALVQSQRDGRLDAAALGETLRRIFCTSMPKAVRLRASLLAATRADAALRVPVFEIVAAVVSAEPAPRELATLLELLLELKLGLGVALPHATHEALAHAGLTGRAKALQKQLLA